MPKKRKTKLKHNINICGLCIHYYNVPSKDRTILTETIKNITFIRLCPISKKEVVRENEACEKFKLSNYIWCGRNDNWINSLICFSCTKKKCKVKNIIKISKLSKPKSKKDEMLRLKNIMLF